MFFARKTPKMPLASEVLPGRGTSMPIGEPHHVSGMPLLPPFPFPLPPFPCRGIHDLHCADVGVGHAGVGLQDAHAAGKTAPLPFPPFGQSRW